MGNEYRTGDRVRRTNRDNATVAAGTLGTVIQVRSTGGIEVKWDSGRTDHYPDVGRYVELHGPAQPEAQPTADSESVKHRCRCKEYEKLEATVEGMKAELDERNEQTGRFLYLVKGEPEFETGAYAADVAIAIIRRYRGEVGDLRGERDSLRLYVARLERALDDAQRRARREQR